MKLKDRIKTNKTNEFMSEFDPMGSYTGTPYTPITFEETALAEMEVEPNQDADDL